MVRSHYVPCTRKTNPMINDYFVTLDALKENQLVTMEGFVQSAASQGRAI